MGNAYQRGQQAARDGKTAVPPQGMSHQDAQQYQQGHANQQAQISKKK